MNLVIPAREHIVEYVAALKKGWSPTNVNPEKAAREELAQIELDTPAFLASMTDRSPNDRFITLPDGSQHARLPGICRWMWDDGFCGSINFRWKPGTPELPPTVLGHIGYSMVPWKWGRGYAKEALRLILMEARNEGLPYVELTTDPDNIASQRVIRANGGVFVEEFKEPEAYGGKIGFRFRISLG